MCYTNKTYFVKYHDVFPFSSYKMSLDQLVMGKRNECDGKINLHNGKIINYAKNDIKGKKISWSLITSAVSKTVEGGSRASLASSYDI